VAVKRNEEAVKKADLKDAAEKKREESEQMSAANTLMVVVPENCDTI
jgi:hypothetical protein